MDTKNRKFLLFGMVLLLATAVSAQTQRIFIDAFTYDPLDQTAKEYPKKDINGNLYALVKVRPSAKDFKFDFGYIKSFDGGEHEGESWIYVAKNARKVTITREGYEPLKAIDLGLTLEAGQTYVMQLSYTAPKVKKQMLQFSVKPAGASAVVMIKAEEDSSYELFGNTGNQGEVSKSLPYGKYLYQVIAGQYITSEGVVVLDNENETKIESVLLNPNFAATTLSVDDDAEIYVDNELKGIRMWSGTLKAGDYNVETRKENHRSSIQRISVERGQSQSFQLNPPVPITGSVSLISTPSGAKIDIDGKEYGRTPRNITDILIGKHMLTLSLEDHKVETFPIEVNEDQTSDINVSLSQIATMTIGSHPSGATLYIDGRLVGNTPYTSDMASGDYNLKLIKNKYHTFEKRVHLDVSMPKQNITMSRQYQNMSYFYLQPTFQVGTCMAIGGGVGIYLKNINMEASFLTGLNHCENIYWNYVESDTSMEPRMDNYKMQYYISGKVGYGIIFGTRLRLTPQLGIGVVNINGDEDTGNGYALTGSIGARLEYALSSVFGVYLAPEGTFALFQSKFFKQVADVSSKVKAWATGANCRMGFYIYF